MESKTALSKQSVFSHKLKAVCFVTRAHQAAHLLWIHTWPYGSSRTPSIHWQHNRRRFHRIACLWGIKHFHLSGLLLPLGRFIGKTHLSRYWPLREWTGPGPLSGWCCWTHGLHISWPGPARVGWPRTADRSWPLPSCCHSGRSTRSCWAGWSRPNSQRAPAHPGPPWTPPQSEDPGETLWPSYTDHL